VGAILGLIAGIWGLREALTRRYKTFQLTISTPASHFE
jgi:hypothetical protein